MVFKVTDDKKPEKEEELDIFGDEEEVKDEDNGEDLLTEEEDE